MSTWGSPKAGHKILYYFFGPKYAKGYFRAQAHQSRKVQKGGCASSLIFLLGDIVPLF
jgi:hypothetical protein